MGKAKMIWLAVSIGVVVVVSAVLGAIFIFGGNAKPNYDKLVIKNFESYKTIGAGFVHSSSASNNQKTVLAASNDSGKPKLIGVNSDNTVSEISFVDDKGKETKQVNYLWGFMAFENFTLLEFTSYLPDSIHNCVTVWTGESGSAVSTYLVGKNGKLYRLSQAGIHIKFNDYKQWIYDESGDALFVLGYKQGSKSIYKISIVQDDLVMEEMLDLSNFSGFGETFFVDKFNNVFSKSTNHMIKANKTLAQHNGVDVYKAMNGLVYSDGQTTQYFDANGDLVDANFVPATKINLLNTATGALDESLCSRPGTPYDFLIKVDGNDSYYYTHLLNKNLSYLLPKDVQANTLYKVSFLDDIEYTITEVPLDETAENFVFANDKLYFLGNNEVFYCSLETGAKTVIDENYFFNKIWSDNLGNVWFQALSGQQNIVIGQISADDGLVVNITEGKFEVVIIKPVT